MELDKAAPEAAEPEHITLDDVLMEYAQAAAALDLFRDEHRAVLVELEQRETAVRRREATLEELARQLGPVENANYAVTVQQKTSRWFDSDTIIELAPWVRDVPGVLVTSVDKKKVEALVKAGMVPTEVAEQALRVEQLTPAVTIWRKPALPTAATEGATAEMVARHSARGVQLPAEDDPLPF